MRKTAKDSNPKPDPVAPAPLESPSPTNKTQEQEVLQAALQAEGARRKLEAGLDPPSGDAP